MHMAKLIGITLTLGNGKSDPAGVGSACNSHHFRGYLSDTTTLNIYLNNSLIHL